MISDDRDFVANRWGAVIRVFLFLIFLKLILGLLNASRCRFAVPAQYLHIRWHVPSFHLETERERERKPKIHGRGFDVERFAVTCISNRIKSILYLFLFVSTLWETIAPVRVDFSSLNNSFDFPS